MRPDIREDLTDNLFRNHSYLSRQFRTARNAKRLIVAGSLAVLSGFYYSMQDEHTKRMIRVTADGVARFFRLSNRSKYDLYPVHLNTQYYHYLLLVVIINDDISLMKVMFLLSKLSSFTDVTRLYDFMVINLS